MDPLPDALVLPHRRRVAPAMLRPLAPRIAGDAGLAFDENLTGEHLE